MKLFRFNVLPAFALLLLLASCGKSSKQGKLIPKDAAMVLHLNGKSLNEKLPWDELKNNVLFAQVMADTSVPATLKKALDNPDNSGIDIKEDILIYLLKDSSGAYVAVEGTVKDSEKFKNFNLDLSNGGSESQTDGITYLAKAPLCVGWNKERFVYVMNTPQMAGDYVAMGNTGGMTDMSSGRDLGATCRSVFNLKEAASLSKDEKFSDLMKKDGDVHFWLNAEQMHKGSPSIAALSMMKLDKIYEGSYTTATANFNDGKVDIEYKSYAGPAIKDVLKKYAGGNIDESMLKRIPAKDVAMAMAFHFKPEGIKELLKVMEVEPLVNMGLAFVGFSLDDFIKANKGDIMLAISDFKTRVDSMRYQGLNGKDEYIVTSDAKPDYIFAAGVNDKDAFGKLIKAAQKFGGVMPDSVQADPKISYNTNNNLFAISNSKESVDKYLAGGNSSFDFISKISGNPFGLYVNAQTVMKAFEKEARKDSSDGVIYDASLKFWDNFYMTGGDYSDGGISYKMEINLLDKKTNSLKQLNVYLAKVAEVMHAKSKADEARWKTFENNDTTTVIVPADDTLLRK